MTEIKSERCNISTRVSKEPQLTVHSYSPGYILKCIQTTDPSILITMTHRIVANSNHNHPRILSYKTYNMEHHSPYWKVSIQVRRMKTNLQDLLQIKQRTKSAFSKIELLNHLYSLISALEYLHNKGLAHQNIKLENILFDDEEVVYLTDCASSHGICKGSPNQHFDEVDEEESNEFYTKDIIDLGFIMLKMCGTLDSNIPSGEDKCKEWELVRQRVNSVRRKYGKDISDLIYRLITLNETGYVSAESIRKDLEAKYAGSISPISSSKKLFHTQGELTHDKPLSLLNLQDECWTRRKRAESLQILDSNYLFMPWRFSRSIRFISKFGNMERQSLGLLKKCFKLGSCQNLSKVGKKIGFRGIEFIQSDNGVRPIHVRRSGAGLSKIQQMGECISRFQNLKEFQIEFNCDNITCEDLASFGKSLLKLKYLKKLRIGFTCGQMLCDSGLKLLGQDIKRLRDLRDFHLHLNKWLKISDKGLNYVCHGLSKLRKLTRVTLEIEEIPQIGNFFTSSLGQELAKLPQLAEINLTFYRCSGITGAQLASFCEHLPKMKQLRKFIVNMKQARGFMDDGIIGLSKALPSLTELRELKLNFLNCEVTEVGFTALGDRLGDLTKLNTLDLTFGNNDEISHQTFEKISLSLANLSDLRSLRLVFFQCDKLTDIAINCLAEALYPMKKLNELELSFRWCMQISDQSICKLGEALRDLIYLNKLGLSFDGCKISDIGVSKLGQDLAKLEYLDMFKLEVRECKGIQGSGISKLGECLTKLVKLGQVQLNFCGCGGNYRQRFNEGIISLRNAISKLPKVNLNENTVAPYCC